MRAANSIPVSADAEEVVREILKKNTPVAGQKKILKSNRR